MTAHVSPYTRTSEDLRYRLMYLAFGLMNIVFALPILFDRWLLYRRVQHIFEMDNAQNHSAHNTQLDKDTGAVIMNRKIGIVLIVTILALMGGTLAGGQELPPAPGVLVDVGGYNLHLYCMGEGSPTVVIETGLTVQALSWKSVQTEMSAFARVCTYDRAGYGWSDVGVMPRTARQIAGELVTLLANADIQPPYLLVGHSIGGTYMRYLAATRPELVAGVVLVDASPPDYFALVDTVPAVAQGLQAETMGFDELIFALRASGDYTGWLAPGVAKEDEATYLALVSRASFFETAYSELVSAGHSLDQTRYAGDLGDLPLIVLSATLSFGDTAADLEAQELWIQAQQAQAALSTQGQFRAVADSRHYIYVDQPQAVVDAVRELVEGAAAQ